MGFKMKKCKYVRNVTGTPTPSTLGAAGYVKKREEIIIYLLVWWWYCFGSARDEQNK
jgi:hypothetical protein